MTNGAIVSFDNKKNFTRGVHILKTYNIYGFIVFEIKIIKKNQLFIRVKIRSTKNLSIDRNGVKSLKKYFFTKKKIKF